MRVSWLGYFPHFKVSFHYLLITMSHTHKRLNRMLYKDPSKENKQSSLLFLPLVLISTGVKGILINAGRHLKATVHVVPFTHHIIEHRKWL